jgi:hypothetical protein
LQTIHAVCPALDNEVDHKHYKKHSQIVDGNIISSNRKRTSTFCQNNSVYAIVWKEENIQTTQPEFWSFLSDLKMKSVEYNYLQFIGQ